MLKRCVTFEVKEEKARKVTTIFLLERVKAAIPMTVRVATILIQGKARDHTAAAILMGKAREAVILMGKAREAVILMGKARDHTARAPRVPKDRVTMIMEKARDTTQSQPRHL
jgi:hypothetical protein